MFSFLFLASILITPFLYETSFADNLSPRQHWKQFSNVNSLECSSDRILLQKDNGSPACVLPSTYLKLVDRGYGNFDSSLMMRPQMMNLLIQNMASNEGLMTHWHEMMQKSPHVTNQTMTNWISMMKEDPELLVNMMGPMTSDPQLRKHMIEIMKEHTVMEDTLKQDPRWMESVHKSMMNSDKGMGMHGCSWCPEYSHLHAMKTPMDHTMGFSHSGRIMDMMHHIWINDQMSEDLHEIMIASPDHMAQMSQNMLREMLGPMMNDPELREQMIDLMLQHQEFMNSVRHVN